MVLPASLERSLDNLPEAPGVYRLRDLRGEILYVGKSRCLRDRVRTYFYHSPTDRKTCHLRALTKSIDYIVFETEHQAQEAEWDLIRSHRPEYNTLFLDYWNRPYIRLTVADPYPRIELTQTKDVDDAEYFGPYKSTRRLRTMLFALRETFPIRDCQLDIPAGGAPDEHDRCIEADLGRCTAPCVGEESVETYRDRLEDIRDFLRGEFTSVIEELERKMNAAAEEHNYEAASIHRDRLDAVENLVHYEPFIRETLDRDVWGRHEDCLVVLTVREHRLKNFEVLPVTDSPGQCLQRYYTGRPRSVDVTTGSGLSLPGDLADRGREPSSDEEHSLVESARRTARSHAGTSPLTAREDDVLDEVTLHRRRVHFRRRIDGNVQERTVDIEEPSGVLKSKVIPTYQNDMEKGRLLPDRVVLRLDGDIQPEAENLFSNTRFWFPVHLE